MLNDSVKANSKCVVRGYGKLEKIYARSSHVCVYCTAQISTGSASAAASSFGQSRARMIYKIKFR